MRRTDGEVRESSYQEKSTLNILVKFGTCYLEDAATDGNSFVASKSPPHTRGHGHFSDVTKITHHGDEGCLWLLHFQMSQHQCTRRKKRGISSFILLAAKSIFDSYCGVERSEQVT